MPLLRVICDSVVLIFIAGANKATLGVALYISLVVGVVLYARWGTLVLCLFGAGSSIFACLVIFCLIASSKGKNSVGVVVACVTSASVPACAVRVAAVSIVLTALS